jgi:isopenicillin N synthase-like dioxygenase
MDGHLDPSGVKVLRYIGWNNDHDFLDGKYLEQNEGVTYDLINNKSQINVQENQQEKVEEKKIEEKKENNEINIDSNIKTLMIEDVVNDNRIKFFREPRLGCYLVLDLTYKTSLSYNSLLSAIQCTKNYETAKEEQEARKKDWSEKQEEIKNQIKELKETKIKEEEARKELEEIHLAIAHLKDLLIKYNEKHGPMSSLEFLSEVAERLWQ